MNREMSHLAPVWSPWERGALWLFISNITFNMLGRDELSIGNKLRLMFLAEFYFYFSALFLFEAA